MLTYIIFKPFSFYLTSAISASTPGIILSDTHVTYQSVDLCSGGPSNSRSTLMTALMVAQRKQGGETSPEADSSGLTIWCCRLLGGSKESIPLLGEVSNSSARSKSQVHGKNFEYEA